MKRDFLFRKQMCRMRKNVIFVDVPHITVALAKCVMMKDWRFLSVRVVSLLLSRTKLPEGFYEQSCMHTGDLCWYSILAARKSLKAICQYSASISFFVSLKEFLYLKDIVNIYVCSECFKNDISTNTHANIGADINADNI